MIAGKHHLGFRRMRETDVHALAGPYALDALPQHEARFFETHLTLCPACRDEVAGLRATAARLGTAVAERPPPELRRRVLKEIDLTRQEPPLLATARDRGSRSSGLRSALAAVAASVVIVMIGLAALVARLNARIDQLEARSTRVYSVFAAEDARSVQLSGAHSPGARIVVSKRTGQAVFLAENLPELGEDRVYELWLMSEGGVRPAGLLRPNQRGLAVEIVAADLSEVRAFGVTVEPRDGSLQPTSDPLLYGEL